MQKQPRWLTSMTTDAATAKVRMPWERGLRREAMIARRKSGEHPDKPLRTAKR